MKYNTVLVSGKTADRLLDLLERMEDMHSYFSYHDRFSIDRRHLEFWIDDFFNLWGSLDQGYDPETDSSDLFYKLNNHRNRGAA